MSMLQRIVAAAIPGVVRYFWNKLVARYYAREKRVYEEMRALTLARAESLRESLAAEDEIQAAMDEAAEQDAKANSFEEKLALARQRIEAYEQAHGEKK